MSCQALITLPYKLVSLEWSTILMNTMHHAVTMVKCIDYLPIDDEELAKKLFFCSACCGMCQLWINECIGDDSTGPHQVSGERGLAAARAISNFTLHSYHGLIDFLSFFSF